MDIECPVVDMEDDFLMGRDLIPRFGIGVVGLPTAYPDSDRTELRREAASEESPLRERAKPWSLEDSIDSLSKQKLMDSIEELLNANSKLDPKVPAFYGQCKLKEADQEKTGFTWRDTRYVWERWPAGLKPAVGRFQKVMEIVFQGVKCSVIFVDDLLIYT